MPSAADTAPATRRIGAFAAGCAAFVLLLFAALTALAASRLSHVSPLPIWLASGLFAAGVVGLVLRKLWAVWFALLAIVLVLLVAVFAAFTAGSGVGSGAWQLRDFLNALIAFLIGCIALTLLGTAWVLVLALWEARQRSRSLISGLLIGLALTAMAGWIVGYDYFYRVLWLQDDCLSGEAAACYRLTQMDDDIVVQSPKAGRPRPAPAPRRDLLHLGMRHFSAEERFAFAERGCEAADHSSCNMLAYFLASGTVPLEAPGGETAYGLVLRRCDGKSDSSCVGPAYSLMKAGRADQAMALLKRGCELNAAQCGSGAKLLDDFRLHSEQAVLAQSGCERGDVESCRWLLIRPSSALSPEQRIELRWKVCLEGNVNDCMPLIRDDFVAACPLICESTTSSRGQSCYHCAKAAREAGRHELADEWTAQACAAGYRADCSTDSPRRTRR